MELSIARTQIFLKDILADREDIAKNILGSLDSATDPWGIKYYNCIFRVYQLTIFSPELRELKSKTSAYHSNSRGLWPQKQRLQDKPGLR